MTADSNVAYFMGHPIYIIIIIINLRKIRKDYVIIA